MKFQYLATYLVCGERAKQTLNDIQLVNITFTRKQRLSIDELPHNATNGPLIYLLAVVSGPK